MSVCHMVVALDASSIVSSNDSKSCECSPVRCMQPLTAVAAGTGWPGRVLGDALPLALLHSSHTKKGSPTGRGCRRYMYESLAYCVNMTNITAHESPSVMGAGQ